MQENYTKFPIKIILYGFLMIFDVKMAIFGSKLIQIPTPLVSVTKISADFLENWWFWEILSDRWFVGR